MTKMGPLPLQGTPCMHVSWSFDSLNQQFEWDLLSKIYQPGRGHNKARGKQHSTDYRKNVCLTCSLSYAFSSYLQRATQQKAGAPRSRQSFKFTGSWLGGVHGPLPRRPINELQHPWNLKLYVKLCVSVHTCVIFPLGRRLPKDFSK